jgi:hypothetical protein
MTSPTIRRLSREERLEMERYLKPQPIQPIPRRTGPQPPLPGLIAWSLLGHLGHRVVPR